MQNKLGMELIPALVSGTRDKMKGNADYRNTQGNGGQVETIRARRAIRQEEIKKNQTIQNKTGSTDIETEKRQIRKLNRISLG